MKLWFATVLTILVFLISGCSKTHVPETGIITLTNELFGAGPYYALGLSFAEGKAVSTLGTAYDIDVKAGALSDGGPVEPFLSANTLRPAFALAGEYISAADAVNAFNSLQSVGSVSYVDLASPLKENQVWVVRNRNDKYAKIRIMEVVLNTAPDPDFASCKLEWVYQPDGSATFP